MEAPEYSQLMKLLTKFRLSSTGIGRGEKTEKELQIAAMKRVVEKNHLTPDICTELERELTNPDQKESISQPLRCSFHRVLEFEYNGLVENCPIDAADRIEMVSKMANGVNILIRGMADEKKTDIAKGLAYYYFREHAQYKALNIIVAKCVKRSTPLELCYDRRRYLDGRLQLGYIAQGMVLADEYPNELYVVILDDIESMDAWNVLGECIILLQNNDAEKQITKNIRLRNKKNFLLIATQNMENDKPNDSMESAEMSRIFYKKDFFKEESLVKKVARKMI